MAQIYTVCFVFGFKFHWWCNSQLLTGGEFRGIHRPCVKWTSSQNLNLVWIYWNGHQVQRDPSSTWGMTLHHPLLFPTGLFSRLSSLFCSGLTFVKFRESKGGTEWHHGWTDRLISLSISCQIIFSISKVMLVCAHVHKNTLCNRPVPFCPHLYPGRNLMTSMYWWYYTDTTRNPHTYTLT